MPAPAMVGRPVRWKTELEVEDPVVVVADPEVVAEESVLEEAVESDAAEVSVVLAAALVADVFVVASVAVLRSGKSLRVVTSAA